MAGQDTWFRAGRSTHMRRIEQLEQRKMQIYSLVAGMEAQIETVENQFETVQEEFQAQETLTERGLATTIRQNALQQEVAERTGDYGDLISRRATYIDRVYPGQPVTLQFPAFSARSMQKIRGEIIHVAADAFSMNARASVTSARASG